MKRGLLKLSAACCGESSILKEQERLCIRSLTPRQAMGNALATEFNRKRRRRALIIGALAVGIAAIPSPALAMHISEGILPLPWALLWFLTALPFLAAGLNKLRKNSAAMPELKPLVGLAGAAVFIISCMPIPIPTTGTCSHPCGTGLAALLIGPALTVVIASVSLTLQALFLAHGGLTTLGANIVSMGIVGSYAAFGVYKLSRSAGASQFVAFFLAGVISDWATYLMTALELAGALSGSGSFGTMFKAITLAFVPTQLPLGILEGIITAGALKFMLARRPSLAFITGEKGTT
jgi:cobalt/nickel transport system permease protein